jgi:hypothetical protein
MSNLHCLHTDIFVLRKTELYTYRKQFLADSQANAHDALLLCHSSMVAECEVSFKAQMVGLGLFNKETLSPSQQTHPLRFFELMIRFLIAAA